MISGGKDEQFEATHVEIFGVNIKELPEESMSK